MQSVREKIIAREARIEEAVSEDFYSRTGDLEASLEIAKRKLDQATRQAEAGKASCMIWRRHSRRTNPQCSPVRWLIS
ncbi:MAG: hypothetical protein RQM90_13455 [Methanoculleus sp.]